VTLTAERVIVGFRWDDDEGDDWIEGDGLLDPLLGTRGELIAVAAKANAPLVSVSDAGIADWVTALSVSEKHKFLTMVAEGEGAGPPCREATAARSRVR
jgi:hypothetical protein